MSVKMDCKSDFLLKMWQFSCRACL